MFYGMLRTWRLLCTLTWMNFRAYSAYRANLIASILCSLIPIMGFIWTWKASITNSTFHYSHSEMTTYYLLALIFSAWTEPSGVVGDISGEIEDGTLDRYLIRPIPHFWYYLACRIASAMQSTLFLGTPFVIVSVIWPSVILLPVELRGLILMLTYLGLGTLAGFCIGYSIRILAFFTTKTWGISRLTYLVISFCSGFVVPLDMLPDWGQTICYATPFPMLAYAPAVAYLGKYEAISVTHSLIVSILWALGALVMAKLMFRVGIRRYTAVGG